MEGISNQYIESILRPTCKHFQGVFSANNLPKNLKKVDTFFLVCNFSKVGEKGSHFITIISLPDAALYIDSLGLPCIVPDICSFLKQLKKPIFYNDKQIQASESKFCGFYCILFVLFFQQNSELCLKFDDKHFLSNDAACLKYIQQLLK